MFYLNTIKNAIYVNELQLTLVTFKGHTKLKQEMKYHITSVLFTS